MHDDVLINGARSDADCLAERAFQFGDGLFETIAILDGSPCLWDAHMARLAEGCRRLRIPPPDAPLLAGEARNLCADRERAVLKIYWTAGRSPRGYRRPTPIAPGRALWVSEWPGLPAGGQSWTLRQCAHRLSENPVLAGVKHLNRLDQVVARSEWDDPDIQDGLMLGQDGRVVCTSMANLFLQSGDSLSTPSIEHAGIAGVVRGLALGLAANAGRDLCVATVSLGEAKAADALFLSNSLIGVVRVGRLDETVYDQGLPEHPLMTETRRLCHTPGPWDISDE